MPQKKEVELTEIIKNTLLLFEQEFIAKNIEVDFKITDNHKVNADKQQIEQVLINLISNCLHAFKEIVNGNIKINISSNNNRTHVSIIDNGIGISEEIKDNVFIPYFTTRKNGSGISLTLSKSIMEAHNGAIQFTSSKGKTTFMLTFIS